MSSNGIKDRVAIVGMGCTSFGEHWDKSSDDLLVDATEECFNSSGINKDDVDAFWLGTMASGVSGLLKANKVPFSKEVKTFLKKKHFSIEQAITGGDDYELIFTASPANQKKILKTARFSKTRVTRIGTIQPGKGVAILDNNGNIMPVKKGGFSHS